VFKLIVVTMCLKLLFHDVDYDGTHNYLVVHPHGANNHEWMVAFNSSTDVQWQDGCYVVTSECDLSTMALDPASKQDESLGSFGYPREAPICTAIKIEGKYFKWDASSK
jgi:hypothetical protein